MEQKLSEILKSYEERIEELEAKLEHEKEMKQKYKNRLSSARNEVRRKQEKIEDDKRLKKKYRTEIDVLQKKLERKINYIKKNYEKDNGNIVLENGKYTAYVKYMGRKMRLGTYKNHSEAVEAITRAEKNLHSELA